MRFVLIVFTFSLGTLSAACQQLAKKQVAISGSLSFFRPSTMPKELENSAPRLFNNHPFTLNIKVNYFVADRISFSVEFQDIRYSERHSGAASLQQPGSTNTEQGNRTSSYVSLGLSGDIYARLSRKLYLVPSLFIHYLNNRDIDKGEYYDASGQPAGISYTRQMNLGYFARLGANLSLQYYLKPDLAIIFRPLEFETRFRKGAQEPIFSSPLLIGVQLYLKNNKTKKT